MFEVLERPTRNASMSESRNKFAFAFLSWQFQQRYNSHVYGRHCTNLVLNQHKLHVPIDVNKIWTENENLKTRNMKKKSFEGSGNQERTSF